MITKYLLLKNTSFHIDAEFGFFPGDQLLLLNQKDFRVSRACAALGQFWSLSRLQWLPRPLQTILKRNRPF